MAQLITLEDVSHTSLVHDRLAFGRLSVRLCSKSLYKRHGKKLQRVSRCFSLLNVTFCYGERALFDHDAIFNFMIF